jgi:hypothetical protein
LEDIKFKAEIFQGLKNLMERKIKKLTGWTELKYNHGACKNYRGGFR